jgi:hypothetical protein
MIGNILIMHCKELTKSTVAMPLLATKLWYCEKNIYNILFPKCKYKQCMLINLSEHSQHTVWFTTLCI